MDSSDSYSVDDSRHLIAGVEVMVSFLFIITIMTLVTYLIGLCRPHHRLPGVLPYNHRPPASPAGPSLDEAALEAFPKLLYSNKAHIISITTCSSNNDSKKIGGNVDHYTTSMSSCSVCLADYDESDVLRVLPDCGHVFHLDCVDSWLCLNPTCPTCRKLPKVTLQA